MITTRISACVTCADPITVTTRNPNRRFCSRRCRVADWHAHNRTSGRSNAVANDVTRRDDVVNDVTIDVDDVHHVDDAVAPPKAVTRCPHCQREVTVLTWLLPPAAAHVTTTPPVLDHG